jgi:hypothetical protein
MGQRKDALLVEVNKITTPICWVHPQNIAFVRVNFPDLPIGVAMGNLKWWVLQGDESFRVKNDDYASYKVTKSKHGEAHFRADIIKLSKGGGESYFMPDEIVVSEDMVDIDTLYKHDAMSMWFNSKGTQTYQKSYKMFKRLESQRNNTYAKPQPTNLRPCFFQPSSLTYKGVSVTYPSSFRLDENYDSFGVTALEEQLVAKNR